MGLETAQQIKMTERFGSIGLVAFGKRGIGKTSWSTGVAAEALVPSMDEPNYDLVKKWVIFTPQQFCEVILKTYTKKTVLIWDDAGYWLNRLFWHEQFVREALRYMNLARTQFTSIIFSTPALTMLPNKILELEDVYRVKIVPHPHKVDKDYPSKRIRLAQVRSVWYADDLVKHGTKPEWCDEFSSLMPNSFFEWYEPIRNHYLEFAKELIKAAYEKMMRRMNKYEEILEQQTDKTIPAEGTMKEVGEVIENLLEESAQGPSEHL